MNGATPARLGGSVTADLGELARHAHLILSFAQRDIRAKYKQTVFGIAWAVFQPFSLMVAFTFVFSRFAQVNSEGVPYPIFSYSALIFWTCFATSVSQGTIAMTANANLVRKIYFPRETLLLAVMISALVDLVIAALVFAGMLLYYQIPLTWAGLWTIPLLALQMLITLAVICVTSAVHVHFRDMGHVLPLALLLWLFATPVAYPLSSVPASVRSVYMLNPMAGIIDGYRRALLQGSPPDLAYVVTAFAVALVALAVAYLFFKRAARTFADVI
jgi:lipopolysaccharide transport system permease protein